MYGIYNVFIPQKENKGGLAKNLSSMLQHLDPSVSRPIPGRL